MGSVPEYAVPPVVFLFSIESDSYHSTMAYIGRNTHGGKNRDDLFFRHVGVRLDACLILAAFVGITPYPRTGLYPELPW